MVKAVPWDELNAPKKPTLASGLGGIEEEDAGGGEDDRANIFFFGVRGKQVQLFFSGSVVLPTQQYKRAVDELRHRLPLDAHTPPLGAAGRGTFLLQPHRGDDALRPSVRPGRGEGGFVNCCSMTWFLQGA